MKGFNRSNGECLDDCLVLKAIAGLSTGLVLANESGRVVWLNRAAERVLGSNLEECRGRPLEQTLGDPKLIAFWLDTADRESNTMTAVSISYPEPMELKVNATRCTDGAGQLIGRALLICDVTAERAVRIELSNAVANRLLDLTSGHMPPQPVANLTQQELRILRLVGRGLGNEEIATQTAISTSTVRTHLKSLYRKLNLRSRAEAVSFAVRNHLV